MLAASSSSLRSSLSSCAAVFAEGVVVVLPLLSSSLVLLRIWIKLQKHLLRIRKGVQYEPVEPVHDLKHYVTRESPWKVDSYSSGVSAKLKLPEPELQNLENIGSNDLSKVPSLMKDYLCRRMENDPWGYSEEFGDMVSENHC
ncbi:hypothetical protein L2E82_08567 [Cichorium intybus]|uniref:Uncharacterized protein n=1 Tax=Cichorium intybus TaxID=13427 RepID=A0ACB9G7M2_CICIN|nr:hypothetical protein L2E82_08567 [Cichorium intybus]